MSLQLAQAAATRPAVVGETLNAIREKDEEILECVLEVLETDQLLESGAEVTLIPTGVLTS